MMRTNCKLPVWSRFALCVLLGVFACTLASASSCGKAVKDSLADSLAISPADSFAVPLAVSPPATCLSHKLKLRHLILPTALIGTGLVALESDWLKYQNREIRDELQENIDHKVTLDDFTQYAPMVSVYALNLFGVKGRHNLRDRTLILATASLFMATTVNALKYTTRVRRPDGSAFNSFPSGHTATAFMGAEFLRREFREVSPWIGVAGYAVATATGYFRIHNNRHWLTDVVAGAGIGILSTQAAYWIYPWMTRWIIPRRFRGRMALSPCVSRYGRGFACCIRF